MLQHGSPLVGKRPPSERFSLRYISVVLKEAVFIHKLDHAKYSEKKKKLNQQLSRQ